MDTVCSQPLTFPLSHLLPWPRGLPYLTRFPDLRLSIKGWFHLRWGSLSEAHLCLPHAGKDHVLFVLSLSVHRYQKQLFLKLLFFPCSLGLCEPFTGDSMLPDFCVPA